MERDYYEVLGVEPDATLSEIRHAYREKALVWHPDKNKGTSPEKFQSLSEAYKVLCQKDTREEYDHALTDGEDARLVVRLSPEEAETIYRGFFSVIKGKNCDCVNCQPRLYCSTPQHYHADMARKGYADYDYDEYEYVRRHPEGYKEETRSQEEIDRAYQLFKDRERKQKESRQGFASKYKEDRERRRRSQEESSRIDKEEREKRGAEEREAINVSRRREKEHVRVLRDQELKREEVERRAREEDAERRRSEDAERRRKAEETAVSHAKEEEKKKKELELQEARKRSEEEAKKEESQLRLRERREQKMRDKKEKREKAKAEREGRRDGAGEDHVTERRDADAVTERERRERDERDERERRTAAEVKRAQQQREEHDRQEREREAATRNKERKKQKKKKADDAKADADDKGADKSEAADEAFPVLSTKHKPAGVVPLYKTKATEASLAVRRTTVASAVAEPPVRQPEPPPRPMPSQPQSLQEQIARLERAGILAPANPPPARQQSADASKAAAAAQAEKDKRAKAAGTRNCRYYGTKNGPNGPLPASCRFGESCTFRHDANGMDVVSADGTGEVSDAASESVESTSTEHSVDPKFEARFEKDLIAEMRKHESAVTLVHLGSAVRSKPSGLKLQRFLLNRPHIFEVLNAGTPNVTVRLAKTFAAPGTAAGHAHATPELSDDGSALNGHQTPPLPPRTDYGGGSSDFPPLGPGMLGAMDAMDPSLVPGSMDGYPQMHGKGKQGQRSPGSTAKGVALPQSFAATLSKDARAAPPVPQHPPAPPLRAVGKQPVPTENGKVLAVAKLVGGAFGEAFPPLGGGKPGAPLAMGVRGPGPAGSPPLANGHGALGAEYAGHVSDGSTTSGASGLSGRGFGAPRSRLSSILLENQVDDEYGVEDPSVDGGMFAPPPPLYAPFGTRPLQPPAQLNPTDFMPPLTRARPLADQPIGVASGHAPARPPGVVPVGYAPFEPTGLAGLEQDTGGRGTGPDGPHHGPRGLPTTTSVVGAGHARPMGGVAHRDGPPPGLRTPMDVVKDVAEILIAASGGPLPLRDVEALVDMPHGLEGQRLLESFSNLFRVDGAGTSEVSVSLLVDFPGVPAERDSGMRQPLGALNASAAHMAPYQNPQHPFGLTPGSSTGHAFGAPGGVSLFGGAPAPGPFGAPGPAAHGAPGSTFGVGGGAPGAPPAPFSRFGAAPGKPVADGVPHLPEDDKWRAVGAAPPARAPDWAAPRTAWADSGMWGGDKGGIWGGGGGASAPAPAPGGESRWDFAAPAHGPAAHNGNGMRWNEPTPHMAPNTWGPPAAAPAAPSASRPFGVWKGPHPPPPPPHAAPPMPEAPVGSNWTEAAQLLEAEMIQTLGSMRGQPCPVAALQHVFGTRLPGLQVLEFLQSRSAFFMVHATGDPAQAVVSLSPDGWALFTGVMPPPEPAPSRPGSMYMQY